jgi:hypothetical protein
MENSNGGGTFSHLDELIGGEITKRLPRSAGRPRDEKRSDTRSIAQAD